jgi:hypothetical protein
VCYLRDITNLELVERYYRYILEKCRDEPQSYVVQSTIALCVGNSDYKKNILPEKYQNKIYFKPNPTLRHYWSSLGVCEEYVNDAKKVIDELLTNT